MLPGERQQRLPEHPGRRCRKDAAARGEPRGARSSPAARKARLSMRPNGVKRALRSGGSALGTMVFEFDTTGIARIAAEAGAEFVIFDTEHSGWSIRTVRDLIAASRCAEVVPLV